jgi:TetR/AcrR family transcriptional regulator, transcriptional repressor for nem operon
MPRVSVEQAERNRVAITEASARLFRERGINGVSVADLMGAAGLTHGGFYGHFRSKEALAGEACASAFGRSVDRWKRRVAEAGNRVSARSALVESYLSPQARANPGTTCPASSLAGDVSREASHAPVRASYLAGVEELTRVLTAVQPSADPAAARRHALADFATMVGALLMSRATAGHEISDEILQAASDSLLANPRRTRD